MERRDLRYPTAPARRLDHQVVQVAGRDPRNPRGLGEGSGANAVELLSRLRRETLQVEVRQVGRQGERSQLGEPARRFALARQVAVVLELDLRARDDLIVAADLDARRLEQRPQRYSGPAR